MNKKFVYQFGNNKKVKRHEDLNIAEKIILNYMLKKQ